GLKPIVVINKIDRPNARVNEVLDMVIDLFIELNASDEQLYFPVVYSSGKNGYAKLELNHDSEDISPLLDTILEKSPDATGDINSPLQMLVSAIEYDNYLGKMGTGKIINGTIHSGEDVKLIKRNGSVITNRVNKIYTYNGLQKKEVKSASAGDIVTIAGLESIDVGETVADKDNAIALPVINIDEPTMAMEFLVNDSPFMGRSGKWLTSNKIYERLQKELQSNISLVVERTESADRFIVKGRGELQLSILIENMRREGYEFQVSKPKVIFKEENGFVLEPMEIATVDVAQEYMGAVIELMGKRKGELTNMSSAIDGYSRLEFIVPSRGLIGFRNEFLTETRGTGILNQCFYKYGVYKGEILSIKHGSLIAMETGVALGYSLNNFQPRGTLFINPNTEVYSGMIVGEHNKDNDLVINVCRGKKLTNMRASGSDDAIKLSPPRFFSLELALEYIEDDELLEITPDSIRMRKKILDHTARKRFENKIERQDAS
ncbi:MAG TPA: EF-Tu/IF-2/RF-3 family GTPase, partial [Candidatus Cloacimonadota bacterium]|nr:EF-Tu/IF-2/RF-3 family GTPase [Candidatus Cloacimonadota bacterium]